MVLKEIKSVECDFNCGSNTQAPTEMDLKRLGWIRLLEIVHIGDVDFSGFWVCPICADKVQEVMQERAEERKEDDEYVVPNERAPYDKDEDLEALALVATNKQDDSASKRLESLATQAGIDYEDYDGWYLLVVDIRRANDPRKKKVAKKKKNGKG